MIVLQALVSGNLPLGLDLAHENKQNTGQMLNTPCHLDGCRTADPVDPEMVSHVGETPSEWMLNRSWLDAVCEIGLNELALSEPLKVPT